jgi:hypothetical protein
MEDGLNYRHPQSTFALPNRDHAIQHLGEHCDFIFFCPCGDLLDCRFAPA